MIDDELITIYLEIVGSLNYDDMGSQNSMLIDAESTVSDLLKHLNIKKEYEPFIYVHVNEKDAKRASTLKDHDKVKLFLPV